MTPWGLRAESWAAEWAGAVPLLPPALPPGHRLGQPRGRVALRPESDGFSGCLQRRPEKMSHGPTLFSCGVMGE